VNPSSTFNVVLTNFYTLGSITRQVLIAGNRDSFHLLAGFPEGWEVQSASYYAAKDFNISTVLRSYTPDSSLFTDTLPAYLNKITPMTIDSGLSKAFLKRTISSHDAVNKSNLSVNTSNVKKWIGFSAPLGILLPVGSKVDTVIKKDSLIKVLGRNNIDTSSIKTASPLISLIDSVGFTVIPIVAVLTVKASQETAQDTLYYYTKTAKLLSTDSSEAIDKGDMVFVPVNASSVAVKQGVQQSCKGSFNIITDRSGVKVYFDRVGRRQSVTIYSLSGEMVQRINTVNGYVFWNGIDRLGKQVPAGSYLAKIADGEKVSSQLVGVMR
jgi:hypothetical protein